MTGMNVKMLLPHTPESKRLVDWVEQGELVSCIGQSKLVKNYGQMRRCIDRLCLCAWQECTMH